MFTADVDEVADFYEGLLGVAPDREPGEKAVFCHGGVTLLIHKREAPFAGYPPDEDHHAYAVTNLEAHGRSPGGNPPTCGTRTGGCWSCMRRTPVRTDSTEP